MNPAERIVAMYEIDAISAAELLSRLFDLIGEVSATTLLEALPADTREELLKNVRSFLETPPYDIFIAAGVTLAPGVDEKRWYQNQVDQMNAKRPAMRELLAVDKASRT
jgi:hypothetical protein